MYQLTVDRWIKTEYRQQLKSECLHWINTQQALSHRTIIFEQWFADGLLSMNEHQQDNNGKVFRLKWKVIILIQLFYWIEARDYKIEIKFMVWRRVKLTINWGLMFIYFQNENTQRTNTVTHHYSSARKKMRKQTDIQNKLKQKKNKQNSNRWKKDKTWY